MVFSRAEEVLTEGTVSYVLSQTPGVQRGTSVPARGALGRAHFLEELTSEQGLYKK